MIAPDTRVPAGHVLVPLLVAAACEAVAWGLLATAPAGSGWFGDPRLLAGVHALTVGVVALSLVGAGWQLVPVVTVRPWGRFYPAPLVNGLLVLALPFLLVGFWRPGTAVLAALPVLLALGLRLLAVVGALRHGERPVHRAWLLLAEHAAAVGLTYGVLLWLARSGTAMGIDPWSGVHRHAALLLGGWVGGWIVGVGALLLPMFAVAREPSPVLLGVAGAAWFGGLALGWAPLWAAGAGVAALLLLGTLLTGAKRGAPLLQAGVGTGGLLVAGGLVAAGRAEAAVTVALVLGVLPLVRGVAQRIVPFLAWTAWLAHAPSWAPAAGALLPARGAAIQAGLSLLGGLGWALARASIPALAAPAAALLLAGALLHLGLLGVALARASRARLALDALPGTARPRAPGA